MSDLRRQLNNARAANERLKRENQNLRAIVGDIDPEYADAFSLLCDLAVNGVSGEDLGTTTSGTFESRPPRYHAPAYNLRNTERRDQRRRAKKIRERISALTGTVDEHPVSAPDDTPPDDRTARSYVYFCQATHGGPIKIGIATNPTSRLRELQAASPYPLRMLAIIPGTHTQERRLHEHFSEWRLHGEWFDERADGLMALVSKAQTQTPYRKHLEAMTKVAQPSQNTLNIRSDLLHFDVAVVRPDASQ